METVFVSGCYDILHGGHIEFFRQARALGDQLVVSVATDRIIRELKHREPALPLSHRLAILDALAMIDEVLVGDDDPAGLNFQSDFLRRKPQKLVVTEDDRFQQEKRDLCQRVGAQYIQLPKTSHLEPVSSTGIFQQLRAPEATPMRVDFAGGWLDVPQLARPGGRIVNCTISPLVTRHGSPYAPRSGLGGSAAHSVLSGCDGLATELAMGCGWQDIAVILETGLCIWRSGPRPVLEAKVRPDFLDGKMALWWTGQHHDTAQLVSRQRDYSLIEEAGRLAAEGALQGSVEQLGAGIDLSYRAQRQEGMETLDPEQALARKYCGSGWGGYALYVFAESADRDAFVARQQASLAIEPYLRFA